MKQTYTDDPGAEESATAEEEDTEPVDQGRRNRENEWTFAEDDGEGGENEKSVKLQLLLSGKESE